MRSAVLRQWFVKVRMARSSQRSGVRVPEAAKKVNGFLPVSADARNTRYRSRCMVAQGKAITAENGGQRVSVRHVRTFGPRHPSNANRNSLLVIGPRIHDSACRACNNTGPPCACALRTMNHEPVNMKRRRFAVRQPQARNNARSKESGGVLLTAGLTESRPWEPE